MSADVTEPADQIANMLQTARFVVQQHRVLTRVTRRYRYRT